MSSPAFVAFLSKKKIAARFAESRSGYNSWNAVGQFENGSILLVSDTDTDILIAQGFTITNSEKYEIFSYIVTTKEILQSLLDSFPNNIPLGFSTFQRMHIETILQNV